MFELCTIVDCICGFCALDKEQKLRCGYATGENHIKNMKSCPNKKMKKKNDIKGPNKLMRKIFPL